VDVTSELVGRDARVSFAVTNWVNWESEIESRSSEGKDVFPFAVRSCPPGLSCASISRIGTLNSGDNDAAVGAKMKNHGRWAAVRAARKGESRWVAVMPGLIIPFLVWPDATGGALDAPRLIAAIAAFGIGMWRRSALWSVIAGITTLYTLMYILG
jgi:hypothetical protein